jgi:hypothetical protein
LHKHLEETLDAIDELAATRYDPERLEELDKLFVGLVVVVASRAEQLEGRQGMLNPRAR